MEACGCCNGAAESAAPPSPARLDGGGAMAVMVAAMVREGCGNGCRYSGSSSPIWCVLVQG